MNNMSILLIVIVALILSLSHLYYGRTFFATLCEVLIKLGGNKKKYTEDNFDKYMQKKYEENKLDLPNIKLKNKLDSFIINDSTIYTLSKNCDYNKIIIYIHGGSYLNNIANFHMIFNDILSSNTNSKIFIPIYKLVPQYTYKEAYDMLLKLYKKLLKENKDIILMGDSSGGGLALGFMLYLNELGIEKPSKSVLISPWVDVNMDNKDMDKFEKIDPMLYRYGLIKAGELWAGDLDTRHYKISPIYGNLTNLPKILLYTGTREILYPDIKKLNNILKENNQDVIFREGKGLNHVYPVYPTIEAKKAVDEIIVFINNQ